MDGAGPVHGRHMRAARFPVGRDAQDGGRRLELRPDLRPSPRPDIVEHGVHGAAVPDEQRGSPAAARLERRGGLSEGCDGTHPDGRERERLDHRAPPHGRRGVAARRDLAAWTPFCHVHAGTARKPEALGSRNCPVPDLTQPSAGRGPRCRWWPRGLILAMASRCSGVRIGAISCSVVALQLGHLADQRRDHRRLALDVAAVEGRQLELVAGLAERLPELLALSAVTGIDLLDGGHLLIGEAQPLLESVVAGRTCGSTGLGRIRPGRGGRGGERGGQAEAEQLGESSLNHGRLLLRVGRRN